MTLVDKVANAATPQRKPTLLICWRTSATKSVYTVAVDLDGDPSEQMSVAAIDAEMEEAGLTKRTHEDAESIF